jgi:hypothetical protein
MAKKINENNLIFSGKGWVTVENKVYFQHFSFDSQMSSKISYFRRQYPYFRRHLATESSMNSCSAWRKARSRQPSYTSVFPYS